MTMTMNAVQDALRARAAELLSSGEVAVFLGWEAGRFPNQTTPVAIGRDADASRLVWNEHCVNTLAKYTRELVQRGRVGLVVRGCDSRGIIRLVNDKVIRREDMHLLGVGCPGMRDRSDGLLKKCRECRHRNPPLHDEMLGDPVPDAEPGAERAGNRFAEVEAVEALPPAERAALFEHMYATCIRCYACREVCPCCTCRECFVDARREDWVGKQNNPAENRFYGITRVMHVGDRCIECGECERACPMGLPLMTLNRKVIRDMNGLFGEFEAAMELDGPLPPLVAHDVDDPEEFM